MGALIILTREEEDEEERKDVLLQCLGVMFRGGIFCTTPPAQERFDESFACFL